MDLIYLNADVNSRRSRKKKVSSIPLISCESLDAIEDLTILFST